MDGIIHWPVPDPKTGGRSPILRQAAGPLLVLSWEEHPEQDVP